MDLYVQILLVFVRTKGDGDEFTSVLEEVLVSKLQYNSSLNHSTTANMHAGIATKISCVCDTINQTLRIWFDIVWHSSCGIERRSLSGILTTPKAMLQHTVQEH